MDAPSARYLDYIMRLHSAQNTRTSDDPEEYRAFKDPQQQLEQMDVDHQQRNMLRERIAARDAEIARLKARIQQMESAQPSEQRSHAIPNAQRKTASAAQLNLLRAQAVKQMEVATRNIILLDRLLKKEAPELRPRRDPGMRLKVQMLEEELASLRTKLLADTMEGLAPAHPLVRHDQQALDRVEQGLAKYWKRPYVTAPTNPKYLTLRNQEDAAIRQLKAAQTRIAILNGRLAELQATEIGGGQ